MSEKSALLLKFARAVDRGTLPETMNINYQGGHIDLSVDEPYGSWAGGYLRQREDEERVLAWLRANFVEPRDLFPYPIKTTWAWKRRGRGRRRVHLDLMRASFRGGTIYIDYHRDHEHDGRAKLIGWVNGVTGKPMWRCGRCSHTLTDAEARAMGLVP